MLLRFITLFPFIVGRFFVLYPYDEIPWIYGKSRVNNKSTKHLHQVIDLCASIAKITTAVIIL